MSGVHRGAPPVAGLERPATVLVTGASGGIGLAILRALLDDAQVGGVHAVSRGATSHPELAALAGAHGARLQRVDADLSRDDGFAAVRHALRDTPALDLVVHAAGVLHADHVAPEKSVGEVRRATLESVFALNAFAPILLAQALMPWLAGRRPVVFASLSARVGSIGDNRAGGWYAYRASKAAQNQLMRTFAIEWRRRNPYGICLLLHPGTVATPLSAPFRSRVPADRLFAPEDAAAKLLRIIASSTPADTGRFVAWDGSDIPW